MNNYPEPTKMPLPLAASAKPLALDIEATPASRPLRAVDQAILEAQVTDIVAQGGAVGLAVTPRDAVAQATIAARALTDVIEARETKVIINGKTYLTIEDWQLLAHFYGLSVRVANTSRIEMSDAEGVIWGYEARAEVINMRTGIVVGSADGMCMSDEKKWVNKPMYALRSMAQTRASAKALRGILAFIPVLAGYSPTPAEEMTDLGKLNKG